MAKVTTLGGERLEDLHGFLDEAISEGATGAILICSFPDAVGNDGKWSSYCNGDLSAAERAFIYQSLILLEVAEQ